RLGARIGDVQRAAVHHVFQRHDQVFQHRHARERPRNLETAGDAAARALVGRQARNLLAAKHDAPAVVVEHARNAVDERGLARAVRADEAKALALRDVDADAVQRRKAAELLGKIFDLQNGIHFLPGKNLLNRPRIPSGAATTNSTSSTPTTSTFISEEMVTVTICCTLPSSTAPITGPIQCAVPPMIGIASAFTAWFRLNAAFGSMNEPSIA